MFVYGTLCDGGPNHARMDGARYLGTARTPPRFSLVDLGLYPALVPGGTEAVDGEVYEVQPSHLAQLDDFEEHPAFYVRETIRLTGGLDVYAYLLPPDRLPSER